MESETESEYERIDREYIQAIKNSCRFEGGLIATIGYSVVLALFLWYIH